MVTFGESLSERTVHEEVAGGIGVVTVDLDGRLVAVEFDPNRLYLLDERRLGPQLAAAVEVAEAKAKHTRKALLNTSGGTRR
jgi:DNA-binding protein YbaB